MTGVALALVLAVSEPDAGVLAEAYAACPDVSDAGEATHTDAGWLLPDPHGARLACKLASCESYAEAPPTPTTLVIVTNVATAVVSAVVAILGVVLKKN